MKVGNKAIWISGLFLFAGLTCAHAEIVVEDSLDWLVVAHDHIATAKLVSIEGPVPTSSSGMDRVLIVRRDKSLKGMPPESGRFTRYMSEKKALWPIGTEFLVFFKNGSEIDYAINLSSPAVQGWNDVALSTDFNVLQTKKAILDAVQARLVKLEKERPNGFLHLEVPESKPAYMALFSGSACFLRVPADWEYRAKFLEQLGSPNVKTRATAAYWLVNYPGPAAAEVLKPLLKDPGTDVIQTFKNNQRQNVTVYPVRQAAYKTLTTWGIEVPKPAGYDPDYPSFFLE